MPSTPLLMAAATEAAWQNQPNLSQQQQCACSSSNGTQCSTSIQQHGALAGGNGRDSSSGGGSGGSSTCRCSSSSRCSRGHVHALTISVVALTEAEACAPGATPSLLVATAPPLWWAVALDMGANVLALQWVGPCRPCRPATACVARPRRWSIEISAGAEATRRDQTHVVIAWAWRAAEWWQQRQQRQVSPVESLCRRAEPQASAVTPSQQSVWTTTRLRRSG